MDKDDINASLTLTAADLSVVFNKHTGWIDYLDLDGEPMLEEGFAIEPNFWRAPTDNDYGASLQNKLRKWKEPKMEKQSFDVEELADNKGTKVTVKYRMPSVDADLCMTYILTPKGELIVSQDMTVNKDAKEKPDLMRYGMQVVMPKAYSNVKFYGKGPGENYIDRNNGDRLGMYTAKVADEFWPYIRPQENGNKTEVRYWQVNDGSGHGLEFYGIAPMECSTLNYLPADLDDGHDKGARQSHSGDLTPRDFSVVQLAARQMGMGCVNSWGAWPRKEYCMPYQDYSFTYIIRGI